MELRNWVLAVFLIAVTTIPAVAQASTELIVNGGFESGNPYGWTVVGNVKAARALSHSGSYSLGFGSINRAYLYWYDRNLDLAIRVGQISQSLKLPAGKSGVLSFWYMGIQGDSGTTNLRVSLIAQNGTVISQWDGKMDYRWHQVTYEIAGQYSNQPLTFRFSGTPSVSYEYSERFCHGRTYCPGRVIIYPVYVYVDDVSVTYT